MDINNIISRVKTLLKIDNNDIDNLLTELVNIIIDYVKLYLNTTDISNVSDSVIVEMVISRYNKLGSEGYSKEVVDKLSVDYKDLIEEYSPILNRYRKLKTL